jgi:predicted enzyme related to lactoylglutathione lyase
MVWAENMKYMNSYLYPNSIPMISNHIDYIEFKAPDLDVIKAFYTKAFGWAFTDYGPTYTAFENSGISGGFEQSDESTHNGALVVLYHAQLEQARTHVQESGGTITKDIFDFPGGRRFHFIDPAGNELAVWGE